MVRRGRRGRRFPLQPTGFPHLVSGTALRGTVDSGRGGRVRSDRCGGRPAERGGPRHPHGLRRQSAGVALGELVFRPTRLGGHIRGRRRPPGRGDGVHRSRARTPPALLRGGRFCGVGFLQPGPVGPHWHRFGPRMGVEPAHESGGSARAGTKCVPRGAHCPSGPHSGGAQRRAGHGCRVVVTSQDHSTERGLASLQRRLGEGCRGTARAGPTPLL